MKRASITIIGIVVVLALWFGMTYNGLVTKQETVSQAWGQVQATYQRRLDLIPNLVATVKGYAQHEKSTLLAVTNARAKAYQNLGNGTLNDPKQFRKFEASQAALSGALSRLMVMVERYPNLKASQNFLTLQTQLEGTENRITVARERFNNAVQVYNSSIRRFQGNVVTKIGGGFNEKVYFKAQQQAAQAPKVKF